MTIFAAGCLVYRRSETGVEFLVIHRDRYDDWSFPKGKRDEGETDLECALREVTEETGFAGELGPELKSSTYTVLPKKATSSKAPREKIVRWWLLEQRTGDFMPNDEVDSIAWLSAADAQQVLTYRHDLELLDEPAVAALQA